MRIPLAAVALVLFASCMRTETYDLPETTPPPGSPSGSRLAGIVIRDTGYSQADTAHLVRFSYDGLGRAMETSVQYLGGAGDSTNIRFFYAGTDTLATRIIRYERTDNGGNFVERFDTTWRTYAGAKLQKDSTSSREVGSPFPYGNQQVHRFVYNGNRVFDYWYSWAGVGTNDATDTVVTGVVHDPTRTNGLITTQVDSTATLNLNSGLLVTTGEQSRFSGTYDLRYNPFAAITRSVSFPFVQLEYFAEVFSEDFNPPVLPLNASQSHSGYGVGGIARTENTYTFGSDGRVLTRRFRTFLQNHWSEEQWTYIY